MNMESKRLRREPDEVIAQHSCASRPSVESLGRCFQLCVSPRGLALRFAPGQSRTRDEGRLGMARVSRSGARSAHQIGPSAVIRIWNGMAYWPCCAPSAPDLPLMFNVPRW